ncbi:Rrp15p-domain-containing protein [Aureobasidium melanogenum CBS 110374]|uniref:Rrp15p-domain-containing protein n=1 Tax=Aureobasidium melanogenum (strain CBS 110374) TaxID=1043003 RepID=A0A074VN10_AURM1|nr:Rrp15p-domain-containing protein [Aureobasidium melanogenum CBS 110374]KEQ59062.1 Rrp15p-domain-containing protein [Aureobasidium melanogenum CBS 110374]
MGNPSAKRKRPEGMGFRKPKKTISKKFKKQKAYHSDSESEDDVRSTNTTTDFKPVNMEDSDEESEEDDDEDDDEDDNQVEDLDALDDEDLDESDLEDDDEMDLSDDEDGEGKQRKTRKRNDPTAFATSMSKILGTKLTTSKRQDPVLSRSAAATAASKELADQKLELKAKRKLHAEKREALEKGRVKDVLGLNTPEVSTAEIQETERRLQKTAQRGVVKLFNAVRAAQVQGEQARSEAKREGVVGISQREERVSEMSKKGFLDLIATGGKKPAAVEA